MRAAKERKARRANDKSKESASLGLTQRRPPKRWRKSRRLYTIWKRRRPTSVRGRECACSFEIAQETVFLAALDGVYQTTIGNAPYAVVQQPNLQGVAIVTTLSRSPRHTHLVSRKHPQRRQVAISRLFAKTEHSVFSKRRTYPHSRRVLDPHDVDKSTKLTLLLPRPMKTD